MFTFERINPESACVSPEGHSMVDIMSHSEMAPARIICTNCGKSGTVIVFADDDRL